MKLPLVPLVLCLSALCACQSTETITTTTAPDGVQTTTIKRPVVDPFDIAISQAATDLMQGRFTP